MRSFNKLARLHKVMFKQASNNQFIGTSGGGAPSGPALAPALGVSPFQGFAPKNPQAAPQYNIHNPSPAQQNINAGFAKQQTDAGFNTKVEGLRSGASGPYNEIPGLSDKQREMGNHNSYSQGWRQGASAPTTVGVAGEAIRRDKADDATVSTVAGSMLPAGKATMGLIRGGNKVLSNLGSVTNQVYKNTPTQ